MDAGNAPPASPMAPSFVAPQQKSVPGIAQSIALCVFFYCIVMVVAIPLKLLKQSGVLWLDTALASSIQQLIAWPVVIWSCLRWSRTPFREACRLRPFSVYITPALLIASFGVTILLLEAAAWIQMPEWIRKSFEEFAKGSKLTLFLPVVILAPLAEELFFRGQVLRGYLGRYSVTKSVWMSAVLFGLFHLNPWQGVVAVPLGAAYAWLVLRTGSVLPGMLSHAVVNFSTNYLLVPLATALGYSDAELEAMEHFPPAILAIGVAMAAVGGILLWRQLAPPAGPEAEQGSSAA